MENSKKEEQQLFMKIYVQAINAIYSCSAWLGVL